MTHEIERKYFPVSLTTVRHTLERNSARLVQRHCEANLVFDTPDGSLLRQDSLLRLRKGGRAVLTCKRPLPPEALATLPPGYKAREELETEVADFTATRGILEALGYVVTRRYEKLRETWRLEGCLVCLDRLPFMDCVELEGPVEAVRRCEELLGLEPGPDADASYHALYRRHREAAGLPTEGDLVFGPGTLPPCLPWEPDCPE